MDSPSNNVAFWENVLNTFRVVSPWAAGAYGFHVLVNKVFKYFSDSRDAELRALIKAEVKPDIDELKKQLENIQKTLWSLEQKK